MAPKCENELKSIGSKAANIQGGTGLLWIEELPSPGSDQESIADSGDLIQLRYTNAALNPELGASTSLLLIAGVKTFLPARIKHRSTNQKPAREHITFRAEPALPAGLMLDKNSGLISGKPLEPQESPSMHHISFSVDATTVNSLSVGPVVLASCLLCIRVISLHGYMLYSTEATSGPEDCDELILKLRTS
jgi:hypothetical protein